MSGKNSADEMLRYFFSPVAAESAVGKVRDGNEDSGFVSQYSLAVADGMGGHVGGEIASRIAIREFATKLPLITNADIDIDSREDLLLNLALDIDRAINAEVTARPELEGMGTTLSSVTIVGDNVLLLHIGDSRCYRIRKKKITQLSVDHTVIQELLDQGRITHEDIADHPQRSFLTQALMGKGELTPVLLSYPAELGDIYLVCSDGLSGVVAENEIRDSLTSGDIASAIISLLAKAYDRGAPDNVTVVIGEISNHAHSSETFLGAAQ